MLISVEMIKIIPEENQTFYCSLNCFISRKLLLSHLNTHFIKNVKSLNIRSISKNFYCRTVQKLNTQMIPTKLAKTQILL